MNAGSTGRPLTTLGIGSFVTISTGATPEPMCPARRMPSWTGLDRRFTQFAQRECSGSQREFTLSCRSIRCRDEREQSRANAGDVMFEPASRRNGFRQRGVSGGVSVRRPSGAAERAAQGRILSMDKTVAGLVGAVTLLAAADPAQAAMPAPAGFEAAMRAESYADLLKPIPDAVTLLKESDAAAAKAQPLPAAVEGEATVQEAQYYYHHHHHHHHGFFPPFYHHHHHHHHRYYRRYHHHHHHHHHGYYVPYGY
jgi:hypothetical protein